MRAARLEDFQLQAQTGSCLVPGCEGEVEARGLCERHYQRLRRGGSLMAPAPRQYANRWERLAEAALEYANAESDEDFERARTRLAKAAAAYGRERKSKREAA